MPIPKVVPFTIFAIAALTFAPNLYSQDLENNEPIIVDIPEPLAGEIVSPSEVEVTKTKYVEKKKDLLCALNPMSLLSGCNHAVAKKYKAKEPVYSCELDYNYPGHGILDVFNESGERMETFVLFRLEGHDFREIYSFTEKDSYKSHDTGVDFGGDWFGGNLHFVSSALVTEMEADIFYDQNQAYLEVMVEQKTDPTLLPLGTKLGKNISKVHCRFPIK